MNDHPADERPATVEEPGEQQLSAWDRAFDGPPINPRSELIYHDRTSPRSRRE